VLFLEGDMIMRHKKTIFALIFIIQLAAISNSVTLSGTVTDTASKALPGASITLTGLSVPAFLESTTTNVNGLYQFDSVTALATYKLTLRCNGYFNVDSSIVVGSANKACNIRLTPVPSGTLHSGLVSGTWLPSDNPHRILDTAIVKDSLYIAPGCSVIIGPSDALVLKGNSVIGSMLEKRTYFRPINTGCGGTIQYTDSTSSLRIANTDFEVSVLSIRCPHIRLDSIHFGNTECFGSKDLFSLVATDSVVLAGCEIYCGLFNNSVNLVLSAQNIRITNSGINSWSNFNLASDHILIENSNFFNRQSLYIDRYISIAVRRSVFSNSFRIRFLDPRPIVQTVTIDHSNFLDLEISKAWNASDTISNNIIFLNGLYRANSTSFFAPFEYNLFGPTKTVLPPSILPFFGLAANAQENVNGDSCDIWFNLLSDPLFADNTKTTLASNSPAIGAASDGTNIGYYQGKGVVSSVLKGIRTNGKSTFLSIRSLPNRKILVPATLANFPLTFLIYDLSGRCIYRKELQSGQGSISLPLSLSTGTYVSVLFYNNRTMTSKFVLHD
jgi:hypothetical protein